QNIQMSLRGSPDPTGQVNLPRKYWPVHNRKQSPPRDSKRRQVDATMNRHAPSVGRRGPCISVHPSWIGWSTMDQNFISTLRAAHRGEVIGREDGAYDEARMMYTGMIDKRPLLIARCLDTADVIAAVNFGRDQGLPIAIRVGGHS